MFHRLKHFDILLQLTTKVDNLIALPISQKLFFRTFHYILLEKKMELLIKLEFQYKSIDLL